MKYFFVILAIFSPFVNLEARPLYEWGAAAGAGYISDYPAANQGRWRYIVAPSFVYRGDILRSDRRGTRARFFKDERYDLDLSFGASFPASSKDNDAREGMADLDWLGEMGPRLNIEIYQNKDTTITIELPVRAIISTDFQFTKYRGLRFYPQLELWNRINKKFQLGLSLKMNWATEELTDYFYQVEGSDVLPDREAFDAKAGYMGSALSSFLMYRYEKLFYGIGTRYTRFDGSTNQNSPLFKSKEDLTVFLVFNYFFYQSKEQGTR